MRWVILFLQGFCRNKGCITDTTNKAMEWRVELFAKHWYNLAKSYFFANCFPALPKGIRCTFCWVWFIINSCCPDRNISWCFCLSTLFWMQRHWRCAGSFSDFTIWDVWVYTLKWFSVEKYGELVCNFLMSTYKIVVHLLITMMQRTIKVATSMLKIIYATRTRTNTTTEIVLCILDITSLWKVLHYTQFTHYT